MKEIKRRFRIIMAKVKKFLGLVNPKKERWIRERKKILTAMTGGPVCFKHLEQLRVDKIGDLNLQDIIQEEDRNKAYKNFCVLLDRDLEKMVAQLSGKGIEIGHVLSDGQNPKTFYYIVETEGNLKRIRSFVGR